MNRNEMIALRTGSVIRGKHGGYYVVGDDYKSQRKWSRGEYRDIPMRRVIYTLKTVEGYVKAEFGDYFEARNFDREVAKNLKEFNEQRDWEIKFERVDRAIQCHAMALRSFVFRRTGTEVYRYVDRGQRDNLLKLALALGWKED